MKKVLSAVGMLLLLACNVNVEEKHESDSTTRFDSFVQRADTTLERWGDSAKEKYKDVRDKVKDRLDNDSASPN